MTYSSFLPYAITIYRRPIVSICDSYEQVIRQVRISVAHEVGHCFGIGEQRLHDLGYS